MYTSSKTWNNFQISKERHQISGEILYLYNVKIEGGGLSIWSRKDRNSH